jgi:hypothetical protein
MYMTSERKRDDAGQYVLESTAGDAHAAARQAIADGQRVVTTPEIADAIGVSIDTARSRLETLREQGEIERRDVGARATVWWPTDGDVPADGDFDSQLECRCCGQRALIEDADSETEWRSVAHDGINTDDGLSTHAATCPECIAAATNGAARSARETGEVECQHPDHNSHPVGGDPYRGCRKRGYLPFTDEEDRAIAKAYHNPRESCCPNCGGAESWSEIPRGEMPFNPQSPPDDVECDCGWSGRATDDLVYREPTDTD